MRILAISDSHGATAPITKAIDMLTPDVVCFLGDGARQAENIADECNIPFHIVKGNCDLGFYEESKLIELCGKRIFMTHGHKYYVKGGVGTLKEAARKTGADIVLFGHTHTPFEQYDNGLYMLNPGSCACPRNAKPSCGYVDIVGGSVVTNIVEL